MCNISQLCTASNYLYDYTLPYYRTADKEEAYPSAGGLKMVPWPPRNASVFLQLNTFMEGCNDVLELVVTIKHFKLVMILVGY